ncbi:MAG: YD repeat protein [Microgenomates group bacterium LiPW_31]|nr:MAG: YD repeat protein [Microgenomates group bacterium LiPW_31]
MRIRLGKIFLIVILIPIFLFLFTKEVNAGCSFLFSDPYDPCPEKSGWCVQGYCSTGYDKYIGNAVCYYCVGEWLASDCCDNCGQCGGCFVGGTKVEMSVNGQWLMINDEEEKVCKLVPPSKPIEELKEGDTVVSFDEKGNLREDKVKSIYRTTRDHYYELKTEGGYQTNVTGEHPFLAISNGSKRFVTIENLKVGDTVFVLKDRKLEPQKITKLVRIRGPTEVYNLTVEGEETFFANGFAVHNKGEDTTPPACQNVIPRTPTGGFSFRSLNNPGFEQGSAYWNIYNGAVRNEADFCAGNKRSPHSGSKLLHLDRDNLGEGSATYQIGVAPNHVYRVSVWGMASKCKYEDCWAKVEPYLTAESGGVTKTKTVETPAWFTWGQDNVTIWANSNILTVTLRAKGSDCWQNSGGAAFDDLTIEELPTSTCSSQNCLLEVYATDDRGVEEMRFSNDKVNWSAYEGYNLVKMPYTLGSNGRVWAQFKDGAGNESTISDACSGTCNIPPPTGTITGTTYNSTNPGTSCSNLTSRPTLGSVTVTTRHGGTGQETTTTSGGAGGFSFPNLPGGSYSFPSVSKTGYYHNLTCPASITIPPDGVVNLGLSELKPAWYQTKDGDIHGNSDVSTAIPDTCVSPSCTPYLSLNGDGGFPGVVSTGGDIDVGTYAQVSADPYNWQVEDPNEDITPDIGFGANRAVYDYEFFYKKLDSPTEDDFDGSRPTLPPTNGKAYFDDDSSGTVTTSGNWSVGADEKIVILIDGNLRIGQKITVEEGGFLAFIVSQDITVDPNLGNNPASANRDDPVVEGVFIADGTIDTQLGVFTHERFVGRGMFVADANLDGAGGFSFGRNLEENNASFAAEYFEYRPDFLVNFPREFATRRMTWREVAP